MQRLYFPLARGFSLIEAMIAMAVLGIVLSLAVPGFASSQARIEVRGNTAALQGNLAWARSEAVKRNRDLVLCPSGGDGCADTTDWARGWIGFLDQNRDRRRQPTEPILLEQSPIESLSISSTIGRKLVRFSPDGMAMGSNLTLTLCHDRGQIDGEQVIVAINGRIRTRQAPAGSCF